MDRIVRKKIIERFYQALDRIIDDNAIRGVNTYCRLYEIDRRNLQAQRKDLDRGWFDVSWLVPLVSKYKISATWLLTGSGEMYQS